jgi:hypothetical protein
MAIQDVLSRLDGLRQTGTGRWVARCPAHDDKRPSLSVREVDSGTVLLHCFAGCEIGEVLGAIGLQSRDLYPPQERRPSVDKVRRERMPFSYSDALKCISFEATLAAVAAGNLAQGVILTDGDRSRLMVAAGRINHALEVCNERQ